MIIQAQRTRNNVLVGFFTLLSNVHEQKAVHSPWVTGYSQDVGSQDFGMSIVYSVHFIAYFLPTASDPERQSDLTFAVFNSHAILDALREKYRFDRLRTKIRGNQFDNPNRGRINTLLGDHFGYEIEEEGEGGSDEPVT